LPLLLVLGTARAEEGLPNDPSKTAYHLFDPTPRGLLRELKSDRPSKADTPYTVDAGHAIFETSIVEGLLDRHGEEGIRDRRAVLVLPTKVRLGIFTDLEVQAYLVPLAGQQWLDVRKGRHSRQLGPNANAAALKWNLYGNDGGPFAIALMPFVEGPSPTEPLESGSGERGTRRVQPGLRIPFEIDLPAGFELEAHVESMASWSHAERRYIPEGSVAITLEYELPGKVTPYIEGFIEAEVGRRVELHATFDVGILWLVTEDFQLDAAVNIGLTPRSPDVVALFGFSLRL
jgi:hypothetical protein